MRAIAAGAPLTSTRVHAHGRTCARDVTFGLLVYRSTDNLVVYDGALHEHRGRHPRESSGQPFEWSTSEFPRASHTRPLPVE